MLPSLHNRPFLLLSFWSEGWVSGLLIRLPRELWWDAWGENWLDGISFTSTYRWRKEGLFTIICHDWGQWSWAEKLSESFPPLLSETAKKSLLLLRGWDEEWRKETGLMAYPSFLQNIEVTDDYLFATIQGAFKFPYSTFAAMCWDGSATLTRNRWRISFGFPVSLSICTITSCINTEQRGKGAKTLIQDIYPTWSSEFLNTLNGVDLPFSWIIGDDDLCYTLDKRRRHTAGKNIYVEWPY